MLAGSFHERKLSELVFRHNILLADLLDILELLVEHIVHHIGVRSGTLSGENRRCELNSVVELGATKNLVVLEKRVNSLKVPTQERGDHFVLVFVNLILEESLLLV